MTTDNQPSLLSEDSKPAWKDNYIRIALRFWKISTVEGGEDAEKKYEKIGQVNSLYI